MTHVLMISQYFPPDVNGSSTRAYNVAKALITQGCQVTVISTFPHYPERKHSDKYKKKFLVIEENEGIKIIRVWIPNLPHLPYYKRALLHISFCFSTLIGLFYVRKIDIIFPMNPTFLVVSPAIFYKIIFRKPILRNVDDLWPEVLYELGIVKSKIIKKVFDYFSKISYKVAAAIIPVSEGYVETLLTKYQIPKEKIFVIEHGVEVKEFQNTSGQNTKNNEGKKTVMYLGAINIGYDFEPVVKAAKILETYPVQFLIHGRGETLDELKNLIKIAKVNNIKISTDILEKKELIKLLRTADIFLLPMASGVIETGLPTKILEYQALGKPIVCVSNGEAGNYIERTKSGLVVPEKNPDYLAKSILKLINDEQLAQKLGNNGSQYIIENLTIEKIGKKLMDVIKRFT